MWNENAPSILDVMSDAIFEQSNWYKAWEKTLWNIFKHF